MAGRQQWILYVARLLREGFLQQNAYNPIDAYCVPGKQLALLHLYVWLYQRGRDLIDTGVPIARLRQRLEMSRLIRLRETVPNDEPEQIHQVRQEIEEKFKELRGR